VIAWDVVKSIEDYQSKWGDQPWENKAWQDAPDEYFKDKFIVDPWDGSRKFWSLGVDPRFKPLDPVPANAASRPGARKNNDNIMEYSCSLWAKARARRTFDENQRVIAARLISLRRNLLDEFDTSEVETSKQCWVIMETLKISPVSISLKSRCANADNDSFLQLLLLWHICSLQSYTESSHTSLPSRLAPCYILIFVQSLL
jgi:endoribonuclease Dicer